MADGIHFTVDGIDDLVAAIGRVARAPSGAAMAAVFDGAEVLKEEMNLKAPGPHIDTNADMKGLASGVVAALIGPLKDYWYYRFFETGTAPHEVDQETARALRFYDGGEAVFSAGHKVRGVAARPFMRNTVDSHGKKAIEAVAAKLRRAILDAVAG